MMRQLALRGLAAFRVLILGLAISAATTSAHATPDGRVLVIGIDGAISVAAARQISRVIE